LQRRSGRIVEKKGISVGLRKRITERSARGKTKKAAQIYRIPRSKSKSTGKKRFREEKTCKGGVSLQEGGGNAKRKNNKGGLKGSELRCAPRKDEIFSRGRFEES